MLFCNTLFASGSDDATCFDLIAVNYNDPKEGVYPMGIPEGGGSSGEYELEKTFEFENISKLKLGTVTITE